MVDLDACSSILQFLGFIEWLLFTRDYIYFNVKKDFIIYLKSLVYFLNNIEKIITNKN